MKKIFILIFLVFISMFQGFIHVEAKTCAEIDDQINKYYTIKDELSSLDCTNVDDSSIVSKCNDLNLQKNSVLREIYRINENEKKCATQLKKTEDILKENENECGVVFGGTLDRWVNTLMGAFYIIGPVLVILFGTLDFGKATISNDKEALKKASNKFFKRLLALIALFLSPLITKLIISLNTSGRYLEGDAYSCQYKNIWARKNIKIVKVANPNSKDTNGNNASTSLSGNHLNWKQYGESWSNIQIGCGNVGKCGCLVTSVAIQVANSGTARVSSFNPGKFINTVRNNKGFTSGGAFTWTGWKSIAPNFEYVGQETIHGNQAQKARALASYIEQGYYPVVEVKKGGCGQHWVAVISVKGNEITIADPGSSKTKLNGSTYSCFVTAPHSVALFKVKGK